MAKRIFSVIMVIIFSIILLATLICITVNNEVLDYDVMIARLDKLNYYDKVNESVKENFSTYIQQSGLDEDILNDVYSKEQIKQDVQGVIKGIYYNSKYRLDVDKFKNNLSDKIYSNLEDKNITPNKTQKQTIESFVGKLADVYENDVFPTDIISTLTSYMAKANSIILKVQPLLMGACILMIIVIIAINARMIYDAFSYIGIASLVNGICMLIINYAVKKSVDINNIMILNDSIADVAKETVNVVLGNIVHTGIICLIVGIVLIIFGNIFGNATKRNS